PSWRPSPWVCRWSVSTARTGPGRSSNTATTVCWCPPRTSTPSARPCCPWWRTARSANGWVRTRWPPRNATASTTSHGVGKTSWAASASETCSLRHGGLTPRPPPPQSRREPPGFTRESISTNRVLAPQVAPFPRGQDGGPGPGHACQAAPDLVDHGRYQVFGRFGSGHHPDGHSQAVQDLLAPGHGLLRVLGRAQGPPHPLAEHDSLVEVGEGDRDGALGDEAVLPQEVREVGPVPEHLPSEEVGDKGGGSAVLCGGLHTLIPPWPGTQIRTTDQLVTAVGHKNRPVRGCFPERAAATSVPWPCSVQVHTQKGVDGSAHQSGRTAVGAALGEGGLGPGVDSAERGR